MARACQSRYQLCHLLADLLRRRIHRQQGAGIDIGLGRADHRNAVAVCGQQHVVDRLAVVDQRIGYREQYVAGMQQILERIYWR